MATIKQSHSSWGGAAGAGHSCARGPWEEAAPGSHDDGRAAGAGAAGAARTGVAGTTRTALPAPYAHLGAARTPGHLELDLAAPQASGEPWDLSQSLPAPASAPSLAPPPTQGPCAGSHAPWVALARQPPDPVQAASALDSADHGAGAQLLGRGEHRGVVRGRGDLLR